MRPAKGRVLPKCGPNPSTGIVKPHHHGKMIIAIYKEREPRPAPRLKQDDYGKNKERIKIPAGYNGQLPRDVG